MILVNETKHLQFLPIFCTSSSPIPLQVSAIHKFIRVFLISLQMLFQLFVSNRINDVLYNLIKYMQYKVRLKTFRSLDTLESGRNTVGTRLHLFDENEKLVEILVYPSNNRVFY